MDEIKKRLTLIENRLERLEKAQRATTSWSVLVVDDELILGEGVREFLNMKFPELPVALEVNLEDAFKTLHELRPRVVVLDLSLPNGDGMELLRQCHKISPGSQVILCSAHLEKEVYVEALNLGAVACYSKSNLKDVLNKLTELLR